MIFETQSRVRLTKSELNMLRQRNARNGNVVAAIGTVDQLHEALIGGLSTQQARDMLDFLETGSSPMTSAQRRAHQDLTR